MQVTTVLSLYYSTSYYGSSFPIADIARTMYGQHMFSSCASLEGGHQLPYLPRFVSFKNPPMRTGKKKKV